MKFNINATSKISILERNVRFVLEFFHQSDEFAKAFNAVSKDIQKLTEHLNKIEILTNSVKVSPIRANANWVRVEKSTKTNGEKNKEYELVQKGFVAYGDVVIELPLDWADKKHKFSSIYMFFDTLKTKKRITYQMYVSEEDLNQAKSRLRGQLLEVAKTQLSEIILNQDVKIELLNVTYGTSIDNNHYRAICKTSNCNAETEPLLDADTIDNIISLDFAPSFDISDSISTEWKVKYKNK